MVISSKVMEKRAAHAERLRKQRIEKSVKSMEKTKAGYENYMKTRSHNIKHKIAPEHVMLNSEGFRVTDKNQKRLDNQKIMAKEWAENMGIRPHRNKSNELVYGKTFIDGNGIIANRKKTVDGKLNIHSNFHMSTIGVGVTKKIVKENKVTFHKPVKHKQEGIREIPQHYMQMVDRLHKQREAQRIIENEKTN